MATFRIWLRSYVRNLLYTTDRKARKQKRRDGKTYASIKDLNISAPLLVNHDGVEFVPTNTIPRSFSVQNIKEPHPERYTKHRSANIEVSQSIAMIIEDARPNPLPTTDVEETEETPSLCEDDDEDTIPEDLTSTTPPSRRISKRYSFLQGLGSLSDHHTRASISRPQSYVDSSSSETSDANRMSHYSVMSRTVPKNTKRMSLMSRKSSRRASVMSDGWEWEDRRMSRGLNRMSWGFETYQTHASMYAPVRA